MFLNSSNTFRTAFKQIKPLTQCFTRNFQNSAQTSVRAVTHQGRQSSSSLRSLSLLAGATTAVFLQTHNSSKILNDTANLGTIKINDYKSKLPEIDGSDLPVSLQTRAARKTQYKQLCYGSLTGLFFGVVIGKLSTVLGFISLSAFLLVQFLQSRGIVDIPWRTVVNVGRDRIDVKKLVLEDPSFKWSFALSFVLAALNI